MYLSNGLVQKTKDEFYFVTFCMNGEVSIKKGKSMLQFLLFMTEKDTPFAIFQKTRRPTCTGANVDFSKAEIS